MRSAFYTRRLAGWLATAWIAWGAAAAHGASDAEVALRAADDARYDAQVDALAHAVEEAPANAALARAMSARLAAVAADPDAAAAGLRARLARLGVVPRRVPGLFYLSHPWTGADLARVEQWLGLSAPLLATDEVGTVESNGRALAAALRAERRAGRHLLVWSASKGSADLLEAVAASPEAGAAIALWIDLVGLLDGTPLTDPGAPPAERAAIGLPEDTARSLSRVTRAPALARAAWPTSLRVVHVAGFPHVRAITPGARAGFERLRPLGPNDGWLLLAGLARRHGPVLVLRDADHYLATADLRAQLLALLGVELDALQRPRDGAQ